MEVKSKRSAKAQFKYGPGQKKKVGLCARLKKYYNVPLLKCNLFSASAVVDKGYTIITHKTDCHIRKNNEVVATGRRDGNLFRLEILAQEGATANHVKYADSSTLQQWHQKLAHQNVQQCKKILKNHELDVPDEEFQCEACIFGKQHRLPFPESTSVTTKPGEVVHADVCGPMEEDSIGRSKYFLLFKDDYSHYRTVYFLKQKSEAYEKLLEYIPSFEADTGNKILVLRTDNGLELNNKMINKLLKEHGIRH